MSALEILCEIRATTWLNGNEKYTELFSQPTFEAILALSVIINNNLLVC